MTRSLRPAARQVRRASLGRVVATLSGAMAALLIGGCDSETTAPDLQRTSEHFLAVAEPGNATAAELDDVLVRAEAHLSAITGILGPDRVPTRTLTIVLGGPVGPCTANRVDEAGRILLCRSSMALGGYYAQLAHELTHALRYDFWARYGTWSWPSFGFFEDGFAEFVAVLVDPDKRGSPFYGYPVDVVAGYWVVSGQAVPHEILRPRNQELNGPCQHQAYPQRASWFQYIDAEYGRDAVLDIAYSQVEVTSPVTEARIGVGLADLDRGWETWVSGRYAATLNADALAQAYRRWVPESGVCHAGEDY